MATISCAFQLAPISGPLELWNGVNSVRPSVYHTNGSSTAEPGRLGRVALVLLPALISRRRRLALELLQGAHGVRACGRARVTGADR